MPIKQKYRILHFLDRGIIGGKEKALCQLLETFSSDNRFKFGAAVSSEEGVFNNKLKKIGCEVINLNSKSGFDLTPLFRKEIIKRLSYYDVHHFHDPGPVRILLSLLCGKKVRVFTRRHGFDDFSNKWSKARIKHIINRPLIRRYFHGFSGNTNHAADFTSIFYNIPRENVYTLYNGINFKLFAPRTNNQILDKLGLSQNNFIIGTACHLEPIKRVDLIIRAFAKCNIPSKKMVILGKGNELENLKQTAYLTSVAQHVLFVGEVINIMDYFQHLNCFILATGNEESFGNSLVEAMSMKTPSIIMDDSEGLKEHIEDGNTGYIAKDENDLKLKIEFIFNNPIISKQVAKCGSEYVRNKYSLQSMKESYAKFYLDVMDSIPV